MTNFYNASENEVFIINENFFFNTARKNTFIVIHCPRVSEWGIINSGKIGGIYEENFYSITNDIYAYHLQHDEQQPASIITR